MVLLPLEVIDIIISHVDERNIQGHRVKEFLKRPDPNSSSNLAALRLVNRAFCQSVNRRLFRVIDAKCVDLSLPFAQRPPASFNLAQLLASTRSSYTSYVREVEVGLPHWDRSKEYEEYAHDLGKLLPMCLSHFPNLTALYLAVPDYQGLPPVFQYSQTFMDILRSTLDILRYIPLPGLRELSVYFPYAYEFGDFFENQSSLCRIPVRNVFQKFRALTIKVYGKPKFGEQDSPELLRRPQFFTFIELAENLTSLSISSYCNSNLDDLDSRKLSGLQNLTLDQVVFSPGFLLTLVKHCGATIAHIDMSWVKLNSGTWQDVLIGMIHLPSLLYFSIESSGYSSWGQSSHLHPRILRSLKFDITSNHPPEI